jgi:deazaflavin-dependent oxidoreductase (nitroreductase family)
VALLSQPPNAVLRRALKLPLWLYRADLGWLLGHHLACITHRGRRTGRVRRTVTEVVRYDRRTREIVVAAGWGGRTDWYRNILAAPALEVRSGSTAYRPVQRILTADETYREVRGYVRRHPWLARLVLPGLLGIPLDAPQGEQRQIVDATLRGVAFRPRLVALPTLSSEPRVRR